MGAISGAGIAYPLRAHDFTLVFLCEIRVSPSSVLWVDKCLLLCMCFCDHCILLYPLF